jgi:hypothetical protein
MRRAVGGSDNQAVVEVLGTAVRSRAKCPNPSPSRGVIISDALERCGHEVLIKGGDFAEEINRVDWWKMFRLMNALAVNDDCRGKFNRSGQARSPKSAVTCRSWRRRASASILQSSVLAAVTKSVEVTKACTWLGSSTHNSPEYIVTVNATSFGTSVMALHLL